MVTLTKTKLMCRNCKTKTNHDFIFNEEYPGSYTDSFLDTFSYCDTYQIVRCCGCDNVSFVHIYCDESMVYRISDDEIFEDSEVKIYPPIEKYTKLDLPRKHVPRPVSKLYFEVLKSFENDMPTLAAIGLRTLLDNICDNLNVDTQDLDLIQKIKVLLDEGLISQNDFNILDGIRLIGNNSVHKHIAYDIETLDIALNVIEQLLKNVYIIRNTAKAALPFGISSFEEFEVLLSKKLLAIPVDGSELTLRDILHDDCLRISRNWDEFTTELQDRIKAGSFTHLSLGSVIKTKNPKNKNKNVDSQTYIKITPNATT